jgi:hypothetical protein
MWLKRTPVILPCDAGKNFSSHNTTHCWKRLSKLWHHMLSERTYQITAPCTAGKKFASHGTCEREEFFAIKQQISLLLPRKAYGYISSKDELLCNQTL